MQVRGQSCPWTWMRWSACIVYGACLKLTLSVRRSSGVVRTHSSNSHIRRLLGYFCRELIASPYMQGQFLPLRIRFGKPPQKAPVGKHHPIGPRVAYKSAAIYTKMASPTGSESSKAMENRAAGRPKTFSGPTDLEVKRACCVSCTTYALQSENSYLRHSGIGPSNTCVDALHKLVVYRFHICGIGAQRLCATNL